MPAKGVDQVALFSQTQGAIGGEEVVVKLFEPKRRGYADAFARELAIYTHLADRLLQGSAVPRLLRNGMFAHTGTLFLALSDEGPDLESSNTVIGFNAHEQMVCLVEKLHRYEQGRTAAA